MTVTVPTNGDPAKPVMKTKDLGYLVVAKVAAQIALAAHAAVITIPPTMRSPTCVSSPWSDSQESGMSEPGVGGVKCIPSRWRPTPLSVNGGIQWTVLGNANEGQ